MTSLATVMRLLGSIREHLAAFRLTAPMASIKVGSNLLDGEHVTVHLLPSVLADLAAALLAWGDTLSRVSVTAWRPSHGATGHLSLTGERHDSTRVVVFGGVAYSAELFADLQPDGRQSVGLSVLRSWAAGSAGVAA